MDDALLIETLREIKEDTKKLDSLQIEVVAIKEHLKTLNGSVARHEREMQDHFEDDKSQFSSISNTLNEGMEKFTDKFHKKFGDFKKDFDIKFEKRVKPLENFKMKLTIYFSVITGLGITLWKYFDQIKELIKRF